MSELEFEFVRLSLANQLGREPTDSEISSAVGSRIDDRGLNYSDYERLIQAGD